MPERVLEIQALTPQFWRDGRPFSAADGTETAAQSLPLPLPSTVAGFVRTQIGLAQKVNWGNYQFLRSLHGLPIYGPLLARREEIVLPAPRDALVYQKEGHNKIMRLQPFRPVGGCNLPNGLMPLRVSEDVKPQPGYSLWRQTDMEQWLLGETTLPEPMAGLPSEQRIHVAMDPSKGKAREGQLFSASYRALEQVQDGQYIPYTLRARAALPEGHQPQLLGFLGGESRPVALRVREELSRYWWDCPKSIQEAFAGLAKGQLIRMVLATPALFDDGWKPGWLNKSGELHLPKGLSRVKLRLVAAAVGRREPVSGWNLRHQAPKPVRWMVPAGSVYFFELLEGDPSAVLESWLRPVSDNEQDRKDGFGLALWGVGSYAD
ncbi:MAG: type III-B CRISPR module-associated protein Cmr3 [Meiothermus ruber]|uniref:Type III-B CRISPR module-associated protein Cmr3 n=1 Tax=Meiothermus ruber TaxID=277 RepID=A0A7C3DS96_MEIRU